MPWVTIILFVLGFVLSKKKGKSNSAALLTGLVAGGAGYVLADPTNPSNLFGIGVDSTSTAVGTPAVTTPTPTGSAGAGTIGAGIGGAVNGAGNILTSMGPGTTALVGGAAGVALAGKSEWLLWGGVAIAAFLLLKD